MANDYGCYVSFVAVTLYAWLTCLHFCVWANDRHDDTWDAYNKKV